MIATVIYKSIHTHIHTDTHMHISTHTYTHITIAMLPHAVKDSKSFDFVVTSYVYLFTYLAIATD